MADAPDREELQRDLDVARAERDAYFQQFSVAVGERNEFLRQRDILLLERDRLLAEHPRPVPAFARDRSAQPSVLVSTLPKSGTEYTSAAIADAAGLARPGRTWSANAADLSGYSNTPDPISTGVFTAERLQSCRAAQAAAERLRLHVALRGDLAQHLHAARRRLRQDQRAGA